MTSEERLTALEDAYFSGHKVVVLDGQRIEYQDMSSMWDAIVRARNELAPTSRPKLIQAVPVVYNRGRR